MEEYLSLLAGNSPCMGAWLIAIMQKQLVIQAIKKVSIS